MTTTTKDGIDWSAAARVAERLGIHTRELVAGHAEAVRAWALRLARDFSGSFNDGRAASYIELAVLVGHAAPPPKNPLPDREERLDWIKTKLENLGQQVQSVAEVAAEIARETPSNGGGEEKSDE